MHRHKYEITFERKISATTIVESIEKKAHYSKSYYFQHIRYEVPFGKKHFIKTGKDAKQFIVDVIFENKDILPEFSEVTVTKWNGYNGIQECNFNELVDKDSLHMDEYDHDKINKLFENKMLKEMGKNKDLLQTLNAGDEVTLVHNHLYKDGNWSCPSENVYEFVCLNDKGYQFRNVEHKHEMITLTEDNNGQNYIKYVHLKAK